MTLLHQLKALQPASDQRPAKAQKPVGLPPMGAEVMGCAVMLLEQSHQRPLKQAVPGVEQRAALCDGLQQMAPDQQKKQPEQEQKPPVAAAPQQAPQNPLDHKKRNQTIHLHHH